MKLDFSKNIIYLKQIDSTNNYAISRIKDPSFKLPCVIFSDYQSKGKGQYGKKWHSERGKNLLSSFVLKSSININDQFIINAMFSLSVRDLLVNIGLKNTTLKWPNDILVDSKKIAGILINNKIYEEKIIYSILGLGLNINQVNFPNFEREPTSIVNEINFKYDIKSILDDLITNFVNRYLQDHDQLIEDYINALYMKDQVLRFSKQGNEFQGIIKSITRSGYLIINVNNQDVSFLSSEIKFLD